MTGSDAIFEELWGKPTEAELAEAERRRALPLHERFGIDPAQPGAMTGDDVTADNEESF